MTLDLDDVAAVGRLRIPGEEIAGEVHGLDVVLGAKVANLEEVHALAGILDPGVQQVGERVGVERGAQK
jgi:hypothetical protein